MPVDYSKEEFMRFAGRVGARRAKSMLESLGKSSQFMAQLDTAIGKELLADLDRQITDLHREVVLDGIGMAEDERREKQALLRAYLKIADRWSTKMADHEKRVAEIRGAK